MLTEMVGVEVIQQKRHRVTNLHSRRSESCFRYPFSPGGAETAAMRLWSLHPKYLDRSGLVTLWREALLAQAVLEGKTKGYVHHPQLHRFRARTNPIGLLADYLRAIHAEAASRGYRFQATKIGPSRVDGRMAVTCGQLEFEWRHLLSKLEARDPEWLARIAQVSIPEPHPLFYAVPGPVEGWEKGYGAPRRPGATDA